MLKRIKRRFFLQPVQYFCQPCIYPYVHVLQIEMEEQELAEHCKRGDRAAYKEEGSLRAWMERVMVNLALQYLRRNDVMSHSTCLDEAPEVFEEPDAKDIDTLPREVLMGFITDLPTGYRTVLNLYVFEGKSHKEIAALLGINEKSSASQLTRAKASLATKVREWIKQHG